MLWIFGDIVGLPFLAAQLIQMIREDEADAKVIDAELDAQDAAAIAGSRACPAMPRPVMPGRARPSRGGEGGPNGHAATGGRPTAGSPTGSAPSTTTTPSASRL